MRALLSFAVLAAILSVLGSASAARAPDVVKKTVRYDGDPAKAFAKLLELPDGRKTTVTFELSQGAEHAALPDRDPALREPDGTLSVELDWRTSTMIRETVTWDPAASTLTLEGWVADMATALPTQESLAYRFSSPIFAEAEPDAVPGWRPLLPKLAALPAKPMSGGALQRKIDLPLAGADHASLELWRIQTWDAKGHPVPRSFFAVEFGAPLPAPQPGASTPPSGGPGSSGKAGRACSCSEAGRAAEAWPALAWGAAALGIRARRRRAAGGPLTSRTRSHASRGRP